MHCYRPFEAESSNSKRIQHLALTWSARPHITSVRDKNHGYAVALFAYFLQTIFWISSRVESFLCTCEFTVSVGDSCTLTGRTVCQSGPKSFGFHLPCWTVRETYTFYNFTLALPSDEDSILI